MKTKGRKRVLVVGAGFAGGTISNILSKKGFEIDIVEKRNHIAGNAFDYLDPSGIRIHKYGPHIFHTNNNKVVKFLSEFTEWIPYKHKVKALLDNGELVTLPPNIETIKKVGEKNLINILFKPYSEKMWGMKFEELDKSIINRIPIRHDKNENYFPKDKFQKMPKDGYTKIFEKLLDSPFINIYLNTEFDKKMEKNYLHVFNSMPIDEYYSFKYGELPYRSIKFHIKEEKKEKKFPVAQVNFTDDQKFTRVVEWKNFPNHGNTKKNILTYEEPCDYKENFLERYYPVKDLKGENRNLYTKYSKIRNKKNTFIGRCGMYVYIDMHQAISSSMAIANKFLKDNK
tara:strand:+ start:62 stop:1087 length:1026 start_codon:yes stop_codon:yes gene_type:complete